jgi:hypothetical protein
LKPVTGNSARIAATILGVAVMCGGPAAGKTSHDSPGSSPLRLLKTNPGITVDDRYAVFYTIGGDHIRIRDTKTRESTRYATPCQPPGFESFRRGYLLLNCSTHDQVSYKVLRVANRAAREVPNIPEEVLLYGVGRYWVAGGRCDSAGTDCVTVYINWHSGEVRSEPGPYSVGPPRNLDDPDLPRRLSGTERGDVGPLRRGRDVVDVSVPGHEGEIFLRVGRKMTRLSRCRHQCNLVEIVPGLVVWAERSVVRGYALPSGRRLRWPRRGSLLRPTVLATAYELYIGEFIEETDVHDPARTRTFTTRWRRALR